MPRSSTTTPYLTGLTSNVTVRGNIFAVRREPQLQRPSPAAALSRHNLFLNDPIGLSYGLVSGGGHQYAGGVFRPRARQRRWSAAATSTASPAAKGVELSNIRPGGNTVVSGNVFTEYPQGGLSAITLMYGVRHIQADQVGGLNDLTVTDGVAYHWKDRPERHTRHVNPQPTTR